VVRLFLVLLLICFSVALFPQQALQKVANHNLIYVDDPDSSNDVISATTFTFPFKDKTIRLSFLFGQLTSLGTPHEGIDIQAPAGAQVLASADADSYSFVDNGAKSYGKQLILSHSNGAYRSVYAHLNGLNDKIFTEVSKPDFKPGTFIKKKIYKGDYIGNVGCTGLCDGAHLHFEIRALDSKSGAYTAVNPKPLLSN